MSEKKNEAVNAQEITEPPKKEEIKNIEDKLKVSEQKNEEFKGQVVTEPPKKEEIENNEDKTKVSEQKNEEVKAQVVTELPKKEEIENKDDKIKIPEQTNEKIQAQEITEPPKNEETENKVDKTKISEQKNEEIKPQEITEPPKKEEIVTKADKIENVEQKNEEIKAQEITEAPKKDEIEIKEEPEKESNDVQKLLQEKDLEIVLLQFQNNETNEKLNKLERDLEVRTEERENYKNKIDGLESEIAELKKQQPNTLTSAQQNEIEKMKKRSEDMLTKAKGIIFEKTKICKNQELQIEALNAQVLSLKDVLAITKDLLEIRNIEVKHLQEKMECMDLKINAERHRQDLMHQKMEAISEMNAHLKEEYAKQMVLFEEMQTKYENDN